MNYLDALRHIHGALAPSNYVEIGCRRGYSLSVARCPAVAIDPDFEIVTQIEAPVRLYKKTSDQFFANHDLIELRGELLDLAFIDGMHDAEKPSLCPRWRLSIPFHLTPSLSRQRAEFRRPGLHE